MCEKCMETFENFRRHEDTKTQREISNSFPRLTPPTTTFEGRQIFLPQGLSTMDNGQRNCSANSHI
jgi:hypothetical protein